MANSSLRLCTVYSLSSSEDGRVRYIGQTVETLDKRLRRHLNSAKAGGQTPKERWIRKVLERGFKVIIKPIKENARINLDEIEAIAQYRANGCDLLNIVDGGQGCLNPSAELLERFARLRRESWANPERKKKASKVICETWKDPEVRQRRIEGLRKAQSSTEYRAGQSVRSRQMYIDDPELISRRTAQFRQLWQDPKHRQRMSTLASERMNTPEAKAKYSAITKKRFENPEEREKVSKRFTGRKHSPETIERMRAAAKRRVEANPEHYRGNPPSKRKGAAEKIKAAAQKRMSTPEGKQQLEDALKTRWERYRQQQKD